MSKANGIEGEVELRIGKRKTGKSSGIVADLEGVPRECIVGREIHGTTLKDAGITIMPLENLLRYMMTVEDHVCIIDDASAVFKGTCGELFSECMMMSRDSGNTYIICIHSWRLSPRDILDMIDRLVIHKTRDTIDFIEARTDDPEIIEAWETVRDSPNRYEKIVIQLD